MVSTKEVSPPLKVFISYSHADSEFRRTLETHLSGLRRTGAIQTWHDRKIEPGSGWKGEIDERLNDADIIILMLSADFVESDYCHDVEMTRAMERHTSGSATVVPVIIRPFDFTSMPFAELQFLPTRGLPVTKWNDRDEAFKDIAEGIRKVVDRIRAQQIYQYQRATGEEWVTTTRVLDACIAAEIPEDAWREVTALIRLEESDGLRFLLEQDIVSAAKRTMAPNQVQRTPSVQRIYSAEMSDVRSALFELDFPLTPGGVMRKRPKLAARIWSGLEPELAILPRRNGINGDSQVPTSGIGGHLS